jgi:hypothetical protein
MEGFGRTLGSSLALGISGRQGGGCVLLPAKFMEDHDGRHDDV